MKPYRSYPKILHLARQKRHNPTPDEAKLWAHLRAHRLHGIGFRRQHAIGRYITDFCAPSKKLVIELDGSQHLDQSEQDKERTAYLESKGYRVLRFYNSEVAHNLDRVLAVILRAVQGDE